MRALLVYESMFGSTARVAAAVAEGLGDRWDVRQVPVGQAPSWLPEDTGLLVVGAPTHAFGMSRPESRRQAATRAEHPGTAEFLPDIGVREWLAALPAVEDGPAAATFATRVARPRVPGSAARGAARILRRHGYRLVDRPTDFWVGGTTGPPLAGEDDRARQWGRGLAAAVPGD